MKRGTRPELLWGIELGQTSQEIVSKALGPGFHLKNLMVDEALSRAEIERSEPLLIWIPFAIWNSLDQEKRRMLQERHLPQRVLLLDGENENCEIEYIHENGFLTALRFPLTSKKVKDAIFRAKEVKSLYDDIFRMTQEIMLERELLARKTDQVLFLNQILTKASQTLDPIQILSQARDDLNILFPIKRLSAAFWQNSDSIGLEAEFFLDSGLTQNLREAWVEYLLQSAGKLSGLEVASYRVSDLDLCPRRGGCEVLGPGEAKNIVLPLAVNGQGFGCLAITCESRLSLGKDQVQSLHAAVNHLSLALRNAMLFREVRTQADHDGLTRIHNRRAFDERIAEELARHQRYNQSLSLLLLDLDHFKAVNDTYGHQAGDVVLKEVGKILYDTLRATDFTARYGGEEFVAILPQTGEDQAWILAERLRRCIAAKVFKTGKSEINITVSIGAACVKPGSLNKLENMLHEADKALYLAKTSGRNMVCVSGLETPPEAQIASA